jgi:hypothetical protein
MVFGACSSICCFRDLNYDQYRLLLVLSIILEVASLLVQGKCISISSGNIVRISLCSIESGILFILIAMFSMLLFKPKKSLCILCCFFCVFVVIISALEIILKQEVFTERKYDVAWDTMESVICLLHIFPAIISYRCGGFYIC